MILIFTTIVLKNDLLVCHATYFTPIYNVQEVYNSKITAAPFARHIGIVNSDFKYNNQYGNKWKLHNISKDRFIKDNKVIYNQSNFNKLEFYHPQEQIKEGNTNLDLQGDSDYVYKKYQQQRDPKKNVQQQNLQQVNTNQILMVKKLENKSILPKAYLNLNNDFNTKIAPIKDTVGNSNDYHKAQNLTRYVTPSPSHAEMHLDLHHHQLNGNIQAIVSHATGSEALPIIATSFKSHKLIYNKPQYFKTITQFGSNQYIFAPIRSSNEKDLSQTSNTLPYPPSFISITTTETSPPKIIHKITNKIPDLFVHRQHKSLWDSYIPSWEITKMIQQVQNNKEPNNLNYNLHTLAIIKPFQTFIRK